MWDWVCLGHNSTGLHLVLASLAIVPASRHSSLVGPMRWGRNGPRIAAGAVTLAAVDWAWLREAAGTQDAAWAGTLPAVPARLRAPPRRQREERDSGLRGTELLPPPRPTPPSPPVRVAHEVLHQVDQQGHRHGSSDALPPFAVRIDDTWYNLATWRQRHPAGPHFIDYYVGRDATEVMYAFHSESARQLFDRLPRLDEASAAKAQAATPPVSELTRSFRELRRRLERQGWWERDVWQDAQWLGTWAALFFGGLALAHLPEWSAYLAVVPLALAAVSGAWLAHDYVHGVDEFSRSLRLFGPLALGISSSWWSDKHNRHHALTNQMGADPDLAMPPLFVWPPHPLDDAPAFRRLQHCWFPLGCATIFLSWRCRSLLAAADAVRRGQRNSLAELGALVVHWTVLLVNVPLPVILVFLALAGLLCGTILTTSHLGDSLYSEYQHDWVLAQFCSTRGAVTRSAFTEWLWGGMQYHLEHHFFPSMPRSRYPKLRRVLQRFAAQHKLPGGYRADDEVAMVVRTWEHLRAIANAPGGGTSAPRIRDEELPTGIGYRSPPLRVASAR